VWLSWTASGTVTKRFASITSRLDQQQRDILDLKLRDIAELKVRLDKVEGNQSDELRRCAEINEQLGHIGGQKDGRRDR
jgi:hypothetical protein